MVANVTGAAPGRFALPMAARRVVVTPVRPAPIRFRGVGADGATPWFFVLPEFADEVPDDGGRARFDVDTLLVPGGVSSLELDVSGARTDVAVAAWADQRPFVRPFRRPVRGRSLDVSPRSQMVETAVPARRICLPTSLAMVLEHLGCPMATADVARRCYDERGDLYGNWVRACLTATAMGFAARVEAIDDLSGLLGPLDRGTAPIVSVAYGDGELPGAPIPSTDGHLLVVRGVEQDGTILCCDPAAPSAETAIVAYDGMAFARACRGVAIIVEPR